MCKRTNWSKIADKICDFQSERNESFSSYGRHNELNYHYNNTCMIIRNTLLEFCYSQMKLIIGRCKLYTQLRK